VPDGWSPKATVIGEAAAPEVVAELEVDDCVEVEPHAATDAATTTEPITNCMDINLCVLVFKILLPRPAGAFALTAGPMRGSPTVRISRIWVADPRVAARCG